MAALSPTVINCTPHPVVVFNAEGTEVLATFACTDYQPRLAEEAQEQVGFLQRPDGTQVPVVSPQKFKGVTGLPPVDGEECPDIIVSMLVGQKLRETGEWAGAVYGPDTGKGAVRDENGRIKGTTRLIQYCARKALNK